MLRGGTTCANENYFFGDVQAAVYKKHGFRALVGAVIIDFPTAGPRPTTSTSPRPVNCTTSGAPIR